MGWFFGGQGMKALGLLSGVGPMEWVIILAIVLLLFGSTKIPQLMRGLGQGVKEFKKGVKDDEGGVKEETPARGGDGIGHS